MYALPSWQAAAVHGYVQSQYPGGTAGLGFNPVGRAYPDVSLLGVGYQVGPPVGSPTAHDT